ncbi:MAG: YbhB/YbcL family Raf kinase inhibitor-like protein [Candidatus Uhrbacteria bacterium]
MPTSTLTLGTSAFGEGELIPAQYTCDGDRSLSPPLFISGVPAEAKSLALIMDDHDVPKQIKSDGVFDHWVLFNIPADTTKMPDGVNIGIAGVNGRGENAYTGPCPPPQYEPAEHRYTFKLYALDAELKLKTGASKAEVLQVMQGHILDEAQLIGRYRRIVTTTPYAI